jgi:hypothetical protein
MANIPKVPPMPRLKRAIMAQKEGSFRMIRRVLILRDSPQNLPPLPKRKKRIPVRMEKIPNNVKIPCQENHLRSISAISGATTKLKFGANS